MSKNTVINYEALFIYNFIEIIIKLIELHYTLHPVFLWTKTKCWKEKGWYTSAQNLRSFLFPL